jgi:HEAT repeat protein
VAVLRPPNVAKLEASGKIDGLVRAAKYKKDPAIRTDARRALTGFLDQIIKRLDTKNLAQLNMSRAALVVIGEPARERLVFILRDGHLHRRQDAAFVLGVMGDPAAVQPLCVALHNPDGMLRLIVVEALGKIGDPEATDTLTRALLDPELRIAKAARKSLDKIERRAG